MASVPWRVSVAHLPLAPGVGEEIKGVLDARGLKLGWLAREAGVCTRILTAIMRGKRAITIKEAFSIGTALGIPPLVLISKQHMHHMQKSMYTTFTKQINRRTSRGKKG